MATLLGIIRIIAVVMIVVALFLQRANGGLTCVDLPKDYCAFSVSSEGTRCILEKNVRGTRVEYECRSSDVMAGKTEGWIETDECIEACGFQRLWVGTSSDALFEPHFTQKFCSFECYKSCPNIVHLFFDLAAGEGIFLPKLCELQRSKSRRAMAQINGSGLKGMGMGVGAPIAVNYFNLAPVSDPYAENGTWIGEPPFGVLPEPYPGEFPDYEVPTSAPISYP